ncbi:MAG: glycosyltransferase family 2 protein [Candidatus Hydrogenedentes bacterium]|nr:glycosyltransferase family 2 protein [Candidatus Hydrogenedentota bacterium]
MEPRVLIIIPAYNEEDSIGNVLQSIRDHCPEYDVVVIDDGSADATAQIVGRFENVALVRLPYNLGIGASVQTGYKYAMQEGYDIAVQCDADGQHPVDRIPSLVARVTAGDADLIIGSRYVAESAYKPSLGRRVGKSILSRLVDAVVGGGITDTTSGFRAANRKVIATFAKYYPDDYPEAEALVIVHKSGLKAAETAVEMNPRQGGRTSIRLLHAVYYMIKVALAIFIDVFRKFTKHVETR